ncbi:MAG: hypothetical protein WHT46_10225, partial [Candidatus Geothermincolales bacterium]
GVRCEHRQGAERLTRAAPRTDRRGHRHGVDAAGDEEGLRVSLPRLELLDNPFPFLEPGFWDT